MANLDIMQAMAGLFSGLANGGIRDIFRFRLQQVAQEEAFERQKELGEIRFGQEKELLGMKLGEEAKGEAKGKEAMAQAVDIALSGQVDTLKDVVTKDVMDMSTQFETDEGRKPTLAELEKITQRAAARATKNVAGALVQNPAFAKSPDVVANAMPKFAQSLVAAVKGIQEPEPVPAGAAVPEHRKRLYEPTPEQIMPSTPVGKEIEQARKQPEQNWGDAFLENVGWSLTLTQVTNWDSTVKALYAKMPTADPKDVARVYKAALVRLVLHKPLDITDDERLSYQKLGQKNWEYLLNQVRETAKHQQEAGTFGEWVTGVKRLFGIGK